jgi:lipopolysaccharide export system protein LptC
MTRTGLNTVLAVTAVVLGGLAVWQWQLRQVPEVEPPQRSDYILRSFELTTLGSDGKESFTVRGPYLQRDVGGRSLSLVQPRFAFPNSEGERWQARSDAAWVSPGADEVHLIDKVQMVGPPTDTGLRIHFDTERLTILPDEDKAHSDQRVTVTRGESILTGTGLRVDMRAKRYQLLNEGHFTHAPDRR